MKAVVISEPGGPDVLELRDAPLPDPGPGEVRIRVYAAGVNRPDVIQRQGRYPAPPGVPADIPGLEVAGVVDMVGKDAPRWKVGDRVCALLAGGGYAEYVTVPSGQCLPVPANWDFIQAASVPETFFTVWANIFQRGHFQKGETVLVHGGSSGIGVAAIQMISTMGGKIIITAGTDEKCAFCKRLGADRSINYRTEDFESVIREEFGGVDIILDMIGGDYTPKNLNCLREEGRLIIINAMNGRQAEVDLMRVMVKRLTITGSTLRVRSPEFKQRIAEELESNIWPLMADGSIKPVVFRTFSFGNALSAHKLMETSEHMGKIVLEMN
ncbi:NAD(P)H-quinone oxidoreductase [Fulvivirga sedimenti]|uniref:NAD(P)H-quinone oxidoreductase n=1 Tax=Fulvivirga sedimenti TaxID=2879465 RepID=A0A9X1HUG1_9BACT|nr:NAD(P)H-quinone oxidoreductase [Fulvivirga sedimenti]MCA6074732.1 NAD(P)H-quinone oxidoreductase [Fulvivirga sedimenti]MCA6075909.1 NAD(P)H-quinone oxidoreductase [Fulvivirga sedimenti]MCA6077037.1 NAD(P)H-quinone oxidoreductase [Fulvivirga sedimenti]